MRQALPPMGPWADQLIQGSALAQIIAQPVTRLFEQGYSNFWDLFVKRYDLDLRMEHNVKTVRKLDATDQTVEVTTSSGHTYRFDHVVLAVPPSRAAEVLPSSYSGFWEGISYMPIQSVAWRATKNVDLGADVPNLLLYPESCETNLGGTSGAIANGVAYAISDEYSDGVYVTLGYPQTEGTELLAKQAAQVTSLLQTNVTPVATSYSNWPAVALSPNYAPFHSWLQENQGNNGFTYVGEAISGNNVPSIMEDVTSMFITQRWLQ
jgi:predicted NAD/FAD-dependent oxidoreductase